MLLSAAIPHIDKGYSCHKEHFFFDQRDFPVKICLALNKSGVQIHSYTSCFQGDKAQNLKEPLRALIQLVLVICGNIGRISIEVSKEQK